jgi:hypothetical protein
MKFKKLTAILLMSIITLPVLSGCGKNANTDNDNNKAGEQANTNQGITETKNVGDLVIENTSLVYENGTSVLVTNVKNNGTTDVYVGSINIKFTAADGSEILTMLGYLGSNLKPSESKTLTTSVDQDLSSAKKVEYSLNSTTQQ